MDDFGSPEVAGAWMPVSLDGRLLFPLYRVTLLCKEPPFGGT
jgi:hypothetical protein